MEGKIRFTINEIFAINMSLEKLCSQDIEYSVSIGYSLLKKKDELTDICRYAYGRMGQVIDSDNMSRNELTETEKNIYDMIMSSEIYIEPFKFDKEKLFNNEKVMLSVNDIENISRLFTKTNGND